MWKDRQNNVGGRKGRGLGTFSNFPEGGLGIEGRKRSRKEKKSNTKKPLKKEKAQEGS